MSDGNIEVVRRGFELWNAGDMEGLWELYDPDVVGHHPEGWPEPGPSVGRDALFEQFRTLREDWTGDILEIEAVAADDNWVVVMQRWAAVGRSSGAETTMELATAFRVSEGRLAEVRWYWELDEALEATGLREAPPGG